MKEEMQIAVVEQLPKITEKIKEVGAELDKRLEDLNLNSLVCNEETRKSIKELRTKLGAELKDFERQRKDIKEKINAPYDLFNKTYETEIKSKYQQADLTLKTKIDEVENGLKEKAKELALEYFNEYKASKTVIKDNYLLFEELNLQIGLDGLTVKGALVKKYKDAIIEKVDNVERDIETINTMEHNSEILVEYLKNKNLSLAIKEVNDRHVILNQVQKDYEIVQEEQKQEEQVVEKVEKELSAPVEGKKLYSIKFKATSTYENLSYLVKVMRERGIEYEQFK
ncbi:MAG TPA: hypothetical protein DDW20_05375 [Firmicutes bacterium]|nr:hypothetical protein [Bacillota bacterium]